MILSSAVLRRAALCVSLSSVLVACGGDRSEYVYETLADADKAGEITRGWIPEDLIPGSSRTIRLVEELSPSREWCAFEFLPTASERLQSLKRADALPPAANEIGSPHVSWWPSVLEGKLDLVKIHKAGFQLYIVERPATSVTTEVLLFAIDWSNGRGFFYSTRKRA
jgi:hypothetical protein